MMMRLTSFCLILNKRISQFKASEVSVQYASNESLVEYNTNESQKSQKGFRKPKAHQITHQPYSELKPNISKYGKLALSSHLNNLAQKLHARDTIDHMNKSSHNFGAFPHTEALASAKETPDMTINQSQYTTSRKSAKSNLKHLPNGNFYLPEQPQSKSQRRTIPIANQSFVSHPNYHRSATNNSQKYKIFLPRNGMSTEPISETNRSILNKIRKNPRINLSYAKAANLVYSSNPYQNSTVEISTIPASGF